MESVAANMFVILKMNLAEYGCKLQRCPTSPRCAIGRSDAVRLFTWIQCGVQQPRSNDCQIYIAQGWRDRMSADVCLKYSPGYYMKLMLSIKSCCTVSLTIPNLLTVKREILLCSRWVNIPTLTWKTQLASILSMFGNIQHLAQQQSQCKPQWSMLRKKTYHHFRQAIMANRHSCPPNDVIKRMKARAAWKQTESEPMGHCATCDANRSLWPRNNEKCSS